MSSCNVTVIYTHLTSTLKLTTSTELLIFTFSSFALKIAIQELAKYSVFKQKVQSVVTMAAIVGVPMILIDTQMRIVLLRAQSTNMTLSGTLAMALAEICLRCGKSFHVKYKIKRERTKSQVPSVVAVVEAGSRRAITQQPTSPGPFQSSTSAAKEPLSSSPAAPDPKAEFEIWRIRLLHYHAAEVHIDVFAEYVALGRSYVIVFFCWDHPSFCSVATRTSKIESDTPGTQTRSLSKIMGDPHVILVTW